MAHPVFPPRLNINAADQSPTRANAPSVRKYQAGQVTGPLAELPIAGLGPIASALTYSPEAEAGAKETLFKLLGRTVKDIPVRTVSEWVGKSTTEAALNNLAEKENKLIRGEVYPGTMSRKPYKMEYALDPEIIKKHESAFQQWVNSPYAKYASPQDIADYEANMRAMRRDYEAAVKDPSKVFIEKIEGVDYPKFFSEHSKMQPDVVSSPEQSAIRVYRQTPSSFQQLARRGALRQVHKDIIAKNAVLDADFPSSVEDAIKKYQILSNLAAANLKLKSAKSPLYRGLEIQDMAAAENLYGKGFGSFSYDPQIAERFVGGSLPSRTGVLTRLVPEHRGAVKGVDISDSRFNPAGPEVTDELEVLLAPNQGFGIKDYAITPEDKLLLDIYHNPDIVKGSKFYAHGGPVYGITKDSAPLARLKQLHEQEQAARSRAQSVMSRSTAEEDMWKPEYERSIPLEAPMFAPDDLIGTGIPSKIAAALSKVSLSKLAPLALAGVIKEKGGNWLSGSVEGALSGLKKPHRISGQSLEDLTGNTTLWTNYMNVPRSERGNSFSEWVIKQHPELSESLNQLDPNAGAVNKFIDRQLTKYVKNEMATPQDPIRALAERGVLHYTPEDFMSFNRPNLNAHMKRLRKEYGFPPNGLATTNAGKNWELISDTAAEPQRLDHVLINISQKRLEENPILNSLPPDTLINNKDIFNPVGSLATTNTLGFDHLIDELSNAINPQSDLPRHLQFPAERLDKVSVPQAVERVSQINAWRAAQKAESDAQKANNAATFLHKDYPDKGFKWVELKNPETVPEGWTVHKTLNGESFYMDPSGRKVAVNPILQDALKYEGDTMGHCVGGYCEDVASGRSRIYSLRDAKGQPHVTIEVAPKGVVFSDVAKYLGEDKANELLNQGVGLKEMIAMIPDFKRPEQILQIKGKQNRAPNAEYLPFVQDFVKSGKWSDVGDLQNTGLRDIGQSKLNSAPYLELAEELFPGARYLTEEEASRLQEEGIARTLKEKGFAHGGSVHSSPDFDAILTALSRELQHA